MSRERDERLDEIGKKIKREIDAATYTSQTAGSSGGSNINISSSRRRQQQQHHMFGAAGSPVVSGGGGVGGGGALILNTITPCAACKLLRRRCAQECPFSPYFSPHEPQKFASVHKVFGASNVSKLLMEVPENQRADAANSLVYEANVRLRDPVYGCMGAISALQQQIQVLQAELNAVRAEILNYKYRNTDQHNMIPSSHSSHVNDHLLCSGAMSMAAVPSLLPQTPSTPLQQQISPPSPTPAAPPPSLPASSSTSSIYSPQDASPRNHHHHHDCNTISDDHNLSFFG